MNKCISADLPPFAARYIWWKSPTEALCYPQQVHGLASACALYGKAFQPSESLKALVCFKDGDLADLEGSTKDILINAMKQVDHLPEAQCLSRILSLPATSEPPILYQPE